MARCHHLVVRLFPKRMDNVALPFREERGDGESKAGNGFRPFPLPAPLLGKGWGDGVLVVGLDSFFLATRTPFVDKGCVVSFRQREHISVREGRTRIWGHVTLPLPFGFAWGLKGAFVGPLWGLPVPSLGPLWFVRGCLVLVWCLLWTIWGIPGT